MSPAPFSNTTTSMEAAASIADRLPRMEALVLSAAVEWHEAGNVGITAGECAQFSGLRIQSATARIRGLVLKGRLMDSGLTRRTDSGRRAIVWRPTFSLNPPEPAAQTHGRVAAALLRDRLDVLAAAQVAATTANVRGQAAARDALLDFAAALAKSWRIEA